MMPAEMRPRCGHQDAITVNSLPNCPGGYAAVNPQARHLRNISSAEGAMARQAMKSASEGVPTAGAADGTIDRAHLARVTFGDHGLQRELLALFDRQAALL